MKVDFLLQTNNSCVKQTKNQRVSSPCFTGKALGIVKDCDVVDIFKALAQIPSPPLKENKVANWILGFCQKNNIKAGFDSYKNIKVDIPPTDKSKQSLLLSAHMDVVGDDSPINLVTDGEFIKTDGKRTLGADDKAGLAVALRLAKEFVGAKIKHGGLEMLFTRDEELGMTGILNANFKDLKSKYVLVLDEARLGKFDNCGAGFTTVNLSVKTPYGGHSGIDIGDKFRLNAAKVISDIISKFPQGVCYKDKSGATTSLNVGTIIAGDIQNSATKILEDGLVSNNYMDYFMGNAVTNVINTDAKASLSIRSTGQNQENKLRQRLENIVNKFNLKYKGLAVADISFDELIPIFEKSNDKFLQKVYEESCKSLGGETLVGSFPAGAETHIYANRLNGNNEKFVPALVGVADIFNMHSPSEKVNFISLKKGYELVKEMFLKFNLLQ